MRFISAASGVESTRNHRETIVGRKLTAACRDAGNSSAMRPVIGATISQKPIMKKPISTGPSTRLSTLPTRMSGEISGIQFFKVTFFSIKTDFRTAIISQFFLFAAPTVRIPTDKKRARNAVPLSAPHAPPFPANSVPSPFSPRKKQPAGSAVRTPPQQNAAGRLFLAADFYIFVGKPNDRHDVSIRPYSTDKHCRSKTRS